MQKNILAFTGILYFLFATLIKAQIWEPPINVTNNSVFDQTPSLDVGPGPTVTDKHLYISFSEFDLRDNRWEIAYVWKDLNALTLFSAPIFATDGSQTGWPDSFNWEPSTKVAGGLSGVFIGFRGDVQNPIGADDEIFYCSDIGSGFQIPIPVSANTVDDMQPSLAIESSGTPHLAYSSGNIGNLEVWFDQTQLITNSSVNDQYPSLVIDANNFAHIAFAGEEPEADYEIWYAENTTGQWQITRVTDNNFMDIKPSLWMDLSGFAHVTWQGKVEGDFDIYYSNNLSGTFLQPPIRVTADQKNEEEPVLVIDPWGAAHIAYQWDAEQIYYTHNMDVIFTTMTVGSTLLSTSPTTQNKFPTMDIGSNNYLHVAYQGLEESETEIYYTKTKHAVPVELSSFKFEIQKDYILLTWQTSSESNNYGFDIERSKNKIEFLKIGFIRGKGTTNKSNNYEFIDKNPLAGKQYYRLKQIDYDGSFHYSEILEAEGRQTDNFILLQNYPNPFNSETEIKFNLLKESHVMLNIYNSLGEIINTFVNKSFLPGLHTITWNGTDQFNKELPSGMYWYQIEWDNGFQRKKMILLR